MHMQGWIYVCCSAEPSTPVQHVRYLTVTHKTQTKSSCNLLKSAGDKRVPQQHQLQDCCICEFADDVEGPLGGCCVLFCAQHLRCSRQLLWRCDAFSLKRIVGLRMHACLVIFHIFRFIHPGIARSLALRKCYVIRQFLLLFWHRPCWPGCTYSVCYCFLCVR